MWPDAPELARVAHDSNNISDPPQRRVNMAMVDNGRRHIHVLNAVVDEVERCVGASEKRRLGWEFSRTQVPLPLQLKALRAAERAAKAWFRAELNRLDGIFETQPLSDEDDLAVFELSLAMPEELFAGKDGPQKDIDRLMVAEAAVTGRTLLLTEDEGTIRHVRLNRWLKDNGWTDRERLAQANGLAHQRLEESAGDQALYHWMLGAFLPDIPSEHDLRIIERNALQLEKAGMAYMSRRVRQELRADRDHAATFEMVRATLPNRARAAEARRLKSVRSAVADSGYR